jgi:hypothetical protein
MPYFHPSLIRTGRLLTDPVIIISNGETIHAAEPVRERTYPNYAIRGLARLLRDTYGPDLATAPDPVTPVAALSDDDISGMRCPITLALMADPVVAADGHSYERAAIQEWIDGGHGISPLTRDPIAPPAALVENRQLRTIIDAYVRERAVAAQPPIDRGVDRLTIADVIRAFKARTQERLEIVLAIPAYAAGATAASSVLSTLGHPGDAARMTTISSSLWTATALSPAVATTATASDGTTTARQISTLGWDAAGGCAEEREPEPESRP